VRLAIDDFGAGHSSLAHLKRLPVDRVKIDVSLIRDIPWDADDVAITGALISLAHSLRREALAEGVESETQIAVLRQHLCDEYQGFFYSRPVPADDVHTLLRRAFGEPVATAERSR
jgi:EAL domain-containing protein (putative c-di-GMP-specific phosphodiesterase class I)